MRKGICQGLANGLQRERGRIRASQLTGHDLAGNGQPVEQEPLCAAQEAKCIAAVLAIIQELFARFAFEAGESKLELREHGQRLIVFAKKGHCGAAEMVSVHQESETL